MVIGATLFLLAPLMAGCKSSSSTRGDKTSPTVSETYPASSATNIAINSAVFVTFAEAIHLKTLTTSTFTLSDGTNSVPAAVTYSGNTAILKPTRNLTGLTNYTATVTTGVRDTSFNALAENYVWSFTTKATADNTAPIISLTTPLANATAVSTNTGVSASFDAPMDPTSIDSISFTLKSGTTPVSGTLSYRGSTALIKPSSNLSINTNYTVTVTKDVKDTAGNAMAEDYAWSFTTGATADSTAPTVSLMSPANAATSVATNTAVSASFSEHMDPTSINTTSFTLKAGTTSVSGTVSYLGHTATFKPLSILAASTTYTATLTAAVTDLAGNALSESNSWTFTTGTTLDTTTPTVSLMSPVNASTNVATNTAVSASFSESMDPTSLNSSSFTVKAGTTDVSGTVNYLGHTATFKPLSNLTASTTYTATISNAATDLAGNALSASTSWTFTTGATADNTAPSLSLMSPTSGATVVSTNTAVSATFSESMDPTSINTASFTLKAGTTAVSGTVNYLGYTATFRPLSSLAVSTLYTATLTTEAKDLAGNSLAAINSWSFTTGVTEDTTAPTIALTSPANLGTAEAVNRSITANFSESMEPTSLTTATFTVKAGTTSVDGTVSYLSSTATFTPSSNLAFNTLYTATLNTGATDLAGNGLAEDFVWTFTTGTTTALGPYPVNLGTAGNFVLLSKAGVSTTGTTAITGDVGASPVATTYLTGFSLAMHASNTYATAPVVTGKLYAADMTPPTPSYMTTAIGDLGIAYNDAAGRITPDFFNTGAGTVGGVTLTPGLHTWSTGLYIPTEITISGAPNDVWIFQIAQDLTVANGVKVTLAGGALAKNIFWQIAGKVTLGTTSEFKGVILCHTLVQMQTGATLNGRAYAQTAITLDANAVTQP